MKASSTGVSTEDDILFRLLVDERARLRAILSDWQVCVCVLAVWCRRHCANRHRDIFALVWRVRRANSPSCPNFETRLSLARTSYSPSATRSAGKPLRCVFLGL